MVAPIPLRSLPLLAGLEEPLPEPEAASFEHLEDAEVIRHRGDEPAEEFGRDPPGPAQPDRLQARSGPGGLKGSRWVGHGAATSLTSPVGTPPIPKEDRCAAFRALSRRPCS